MDRRLELQALLETLAANVYFQPPPSVMMVYPAIVYSRDDIDVKFANNGPYHRRRRYQVTVIDKDPDSPIIDRLADLPLCVFSRHFVVDKLNHDVFNLFF